MTDEQALHADAVPRQGAYVARFAARIEPAWAFVAYGVLWFFVAGMAATLVLMAGIKVTGDGAPAWLVQLLLVAWGTTFFGAWVPFGLWVGAGEAMAFPKRAGG